MLNEQYFLTAGNLGQFIARVKEVLGHGSVTILAPGGFLKVACTIRGVMPLYGGVVYEEVDDNGDVTPRQVQQAQLAPSESNVHPGLPRVQVRFLANTLTLLVFDGTANGATKYIYISNSEPEK